VSGASDRHFGHVVRRWARTVWDYDVSDALCTKIWRILQTLLMSLLATLIVWLITRAGEILVLVQTVPAEHAEINSGLKRTAETLGNLQARVLKLEIDDEWTKSIALRILLIEGAEHPGAYTGLPPAPPAPPPSPP
jgi:hypothetical protein